MSENLNPYGNPVKVGNVVLRTPGLAGVASTHRPGSPGLRGEAPLPEAFQRAFAAEGVQTQEVVVLQNTREVATPPDPQTRSTNYGEPAIVAEVPDPGPDWGQLVLSTDESGVTTWHFPADAQGDVDATRGRQTRTYVIPRRVPASPSADHRGPLGALGKKLLEVLVFPLVDPVLGKVGAHFAERWEEKNRRYLVRSFTPDNYMGLAADEITGREGWDRLAEGRALLMIHGTFCLAHSSFGSFLRPAFQSLYRQYNHRVFAFDHFSISHDPRRNVEWFLEQIPDGTRLDLDVVTSSRGGLVARTLVEKQSEFSLGDRQLRIGKVLFAGGPNAGTPLTDDKHMGTFLDAWTNILGLLPEVGVTDVIQAIVTVAKQVGLAVLTGLDGLQSMRPDGTYLSWLNDSDLGEGRYYALASNFEPKHPGVATLKDAVMDAIFKAENDLVVPTSGVYETNGSAYFPIQDRHVLPASEGVSHGGFFSNQAAMNQLLAWLA